MRTPGGGGYGKDSNTAQKESTETGNTKAFQERGSVYEYRMAQESV